MKRALLIYLGKVIIYYLFSFASNRCIFLLTILIYFIRLYVSIIVRINKKSLITIIHLHNLDRHSKDGGDWGGNDDVSGDIDNDHVDTTDENSAYP